MRKISISLFIFVFVLFNTGLLLSQQNEEDGKFLKLLEEYLDAMWKFQPTQGTMAGFHKYDNKLGDFSQKNVDKRMEEMDKFNQDLVTKVDRTKMSPDFQIDHEMLMDALDLEKLKLEQLIPWEYDPIFYNTIFINAIRPLLTKEYAPIETRAKNALDRLKDMPKFIKQAKELLKTPTQISTETAIKQFPAIFEIYRTELPTLISQVPEAQGAGLLSELGKVIPALEDYQNYLSTELLPKSTGNFRLGEAHARLMRLTLQNNISIQELSERAKADLNNIQVEMALVCAPWYKIMYPDVTIEQIAAQRGQEQARQIIIKNVLDKLKGDHATRDEFIGKIESSVGELMNFISDKDLIELPDTELVIEPMPAEYRGITWTRLARPGVYENSGNYISQIAPIPDDWTEEQANSFLEEYNDFLMYFYSIQTIFPGTFVPFYYTSQNPSLLLKLYPSMPLIKGWPLMLEEPLIFAGFGNYDLRLRLHQLKLRLRAVVDFIAEFQIHESNWTKEQAVAYMVRAGYITEAEAERKWNRILLFPGDGVYAYVGFQELMDLEKEYKQLKGDAFSRKEFMARVLSYGAMPLRHLKSKILEQ